MPSTRFPFRLGCHFILALGLSFTAPAAGSGTGRITGVVSNGATRSLLEGATVEIAPLGRRTLTDSLGRFTFEDLPAGRHPVSVSYIGLNREERMAEVAPGGTATLTLDLNSEIYQLEKFSVVGEREGYAAALTAQRNAESVKNVVATDALGNLSNDHAGELLIRLPGVAGLVNAEGYVSGVFIRGSADTLNSVTVDGNKMASSGGLSRTFRTHSVPGAFFDSLEVTKALTPDLDADSLGGNVNMKTRSPLNLKDRRRLSFRVGAKWAPPFYSHTPTTKKHPIHPLTSFGYQEVFDAFGGERNLGVTFSLFYSENAGQSDQTVTDYRFETTEPSYVWDYRSADAYNVRKNESASLKLEYRFSPHFRVFAGGIFNNQHERSFEYLRTRAFTNRTIAPLNAAGQPTGNGGIMPGFTNTLTNVRPVAASTFELQSDGNRFLDSQRQIHFGAEHTYTRLSIDYDAAYSESMVRQNDGYGEKSPPGGFFRTWLTGVGWELDLARDPERPLFTQTAGPSIYDLRNYTNSEHNMRNNERNGTLRSVSLNARYEFPGAANVTLKTGARWRRQTAEEIGGDRRWTYAGPDGVVGTNPATRINDADLSIFQFLGAKTPETGRNGPIPYTHVSTVASHVKDNPGHWVENLYYAESRTFLGTRKVTEDVTAVYAMGSARWRQFRLTAGARFEETEVEGRGFVTSRVLATAAAIPDPVARARADYNNPRRVQGRYHDVFPGAYLTYQFNRNLVARANWSNSIGRPPFGNLLPAETVNDATQTLTVNNPALKPQHARNIDLSLEYYFEPVGLLSVGVFQKDISDFIVTAGGQTVPTGPNNGFGGSYGGYNLVSSFNGGESKVTGLELAYQQELTFLPGILRGLGVFANYTRLNTEGDYGSSAPRTTNLIPNFVPTSANGGLSFKWGRFGSRLMVNHAGSHLVGYNANAARLRYRDDRTTTNLNLSWRLSPRLTLYWDFQNLFDEPQRWYYHAPHRLHTVFYAGTFINVGLRGNF